MDQGLKMERGKRLDGKDWELIVKDCGSLKERSASLVNDTKKRQRERGEERSEAPSIKESAAPMVPPLLGRRRQH